MPNINYREPIRTNLFSIERVSIERFFILKYHAYGNDLRCYTKVSSPWDWETLDIDKFNQEPSGSKIAKINKSEYEQIIINFFENPNGTATDNPYFIIIGGAGTGKSSAVNYALDAADICKGCRLNESCDHDLPARIHIDFIDFEKESAATYDNINGGIELEKLSDDFWSYIMGVLDKQIAKQLSTEIEISDFWKWLLHPDNRKYLPNTLYRYLFPHLNLFEDCVSNSSELLELRKSLYKELSFEYLAYYKLFQIGFLKEKTYVNCNIILFDNIDTIDTVLQVRLLRFAKVAHSLFKCKAIIPMRPYTLTKLHDDAADFSDIKYHNLPNLKEVFNNRLKYYKIHGKPEVAILLSEMIDFVFSTGYVNNLFEASAGKSVRFALRNFWNFILSPLIVTHEDGKPINNILPNSNVFFQAFFCSETINERMYEENFNNLLAITDDYNFRELSTIKLRLLEYIYRFNRAHIGKIFRFLAAFGYEEEDIILCINDFLSQKKALIWSTSLNKFSIATIRNQADHSFVITSMGRGYFDNLITEALYLRECIVALDEERRIYANDNLYRIIAIIELMHKEEIKEINTYCNKVSSNEYREHYRESGYSISHLLCRKLQSNFTKMAQMSSFPVAIFEDLQKKIVTEVFQTLDKFTNKVNI